MTAHSAQRSQSPPQIPRRRPTAKKAKNVSHQTSEEEGMPSRSPRALSTSLESIQILPRTPKTPRSGDQRWRAGDGDAIDEVELSLLGDEERRQAAQGTGEFVAPQPPTQKSISSKDKRAIALLVVLCMSAHPLHLNSSLTLPKT